MNPEMCPAVLSTSFKTAGCLFIKAQVLCLSQECSPCAASWCLTVRQLQLHFVTNRWDFETVSKVCPFESGRLNFEIIWIWVYCHIHVSVSSCTALVLSCSADNTLHVLQTVLTVNRVCPFEWSIHSLLFLLSSLLVLRLNCCFQRWKLSKIVCCRVEKPKRYFRCFIFKVMP